MTLPGRSLPELLFPEPFPNTGYNDLCVTTQMPVGDARKKYLEFRSQITSAEPYRELHPSPDQEFVMAGSG